MRESSETKGCGCLRIAATGCAFVLAVLVIGAGLVFLNLDRIRESEIFQKVASKVESGKEAVVELAALRGAVLEAFPAEHVSIRIRLGNRGSGSRLTLELVNPSLAAQGEGGWETKAEEIARFVHDQYAGIDSVEEIQIVFVSEAGTGALVHRQESFAFRTSELRGADVEAPP